MPNGPEYQSKLRSALEWSLQATVRQHPGLLYGVSNEVKDGIPLYTQLSQIDRQDVLEIIDSRDVGLTIGESNGETADSMLSHILGQKHADAWPDNKPAWKVILLEHIHSGGSDHVALARLDVAFFAHHAIADGLSGVAFHASLMDNFPSISASLSPPSWPMALNEMRPVPAAVEECVDCLSCTCAVCSSSPSTCDQRVWAGTAMSRVPMVDFRSMVRIVAISARNLSVVLQKCKRSGITLTGLLHAVICTSLCRVIKEEVPGFRAVTPFSVRRHTKASNGDVVNHVSFLTSYVGGTQLSRVKGCEGGSAAEEQHITQMARSIGSDMAAKVKQFPHDGMATQLSRIQDLMSHCRCQGGRARQHTYELSNLGSSSDVVPPDDSNLALEKLVFTQCGMGAGPAIGFNCVSTRGGPLTISITWQEGVVEESLIERVSRDLEDWFGCGRAKINRGS
ncbi:hypothetical protein ACJ41O_011502 [Fusarium nematophilum]